MTFGIQTVQTLLICLTLSLISEGCSAKVPQKKTNMYESIDSVMRAEIGDSLTSLILDAKNIVAERIKQIGDSVDVIASKRLGSADATVTKFLLASYENYNDACIVFGKISPNLRLKFSKRKSICYVYFDFGMRLLVVKNAENEELKRCVLTNNVFLKFANLLFPNDEFLTFLLNNK